MYVPPRTPQVPADVIAALGNVLEYSFEVTGDSQILLSGTVESLLFGEEFWLFLDCVQLTTVACAPNSAGIYSLLSLHVVILCM